MFNQSYIAKTRPFSFDDVYACPVCHLGKIKGLPLMDAMACEFCHQIFTINLEKQQLQMPARQPPLVWRWNGKQWTDAHLEGVELSWGYILAAIALVVLPTILIGLVAYYKPPVANVPFSWVPTVWTGLTFISHLVIICWLVIEFYQFPLSTYLKAIQQRLDR